MKKIVLILFILLMTFTFNNYAASSQTNEKTYIENLHCYPNPFDNETEVTKIKFTVVSDISVNNVQIAVVIYNFNGKKVWTKNVAVGTLNIGKTIFKIAWGGDNDTAKKVANGLYYAKIIVEANNTKSAIVKILVK